MPVVILPPAVETIADCGARTGVVAGVTLVAVRMPTGWGIVGVDRDV